MRVFEFQTPTYERNIISFNQQVLTQNHWDSEYAVSKMSLEGPAAPQLELLEENAAELTERIVDFDDFEVLRTTLTPNHSIDADLSHGYLMIAMLAGELQINCVAGTLALAASSTPTSLNTAALVPAGAKDVQLSANSQGATLLIARPKAHAADKIPADQTIRGPA